LSPLRPAAFPTRPAGPLRRRSTAFRGPTHFKTFGPKSLSSNANLAESRWIVSAVTQPGLAKCTQCGVNALDSRKGCLRPWSPIAPTTGRPGGSWDARPRGHQRGFPKEFAWRQDLRIIHSLCPFVAQADRVESRRRSEASAARSGPPVCVIRSASRSVSYAVNVLGVGRPSGGHGAAYL